ncbi:MAG TPA: TonB-dependent siderophore receptor [Thermoanaerobaculia bacterium]|nr:TonB-dependent siderophore receptor [Thermoanaerobaculia bacterium]
MRSVLILTFCLALAALPAVAGAPLQGTVVDASGGAVAGAQVILHTGSGRTALTDASGRFSFHEADDKDAILIVADGFAPITIDVQTRRDLRIVLETAALSDEITVLAPPYLPTRNASAIKTDTPLRDVPQAVSVITREVIAQQSMQSVGDVVRYVPGVGIAQGEGNRDTPIFRGNSSTSDFFVDGIRDDVQYFRDLYNVERVEALKGPNAMMFGRGGVGGVLNRVTRQADWTPTRELTLQGGSWGNRRITGDFGQLLTNSLSARVTTVYQNSDSYRDGARLDRYGINPTIAFALSPKTTIRAGYEHFHDDRTADRGISSYAGRPVETDRTTFFGDPDVSNSRANVNVLTSSLEHRFRPNVTLRSRLSYGSYDKFYQNVFPGAVDATGRNVSLAAYNNATQRDNVFSQTDLVLTGGGHTILAGLELGRQVTDNYRQTGYFTAVGANVTSVLVPLSSPTASLPVTFRQSATDADNHGIATVAGLYVQDQYAIGKHLQVVGGLRYDRFNVDLHNNRTNGDFTSTDGLVSPRLGLVYKPATPLSIYTSYSLSYLPRAGEQLSSLSISNQSLDPEQFTNYEAGAKWEGKAFELAAAIYRLDRSNVAVADPTNPALMLLVDGQRSEGVEVSASGNLTKFWSVVGAYAYQEGEILQSISATARAGARLAQLPKHSISLWNKVDFSQTWGAGLGVIHRAEVFTSTDNTVTLPSFTRVDAALFYSFGPRLRAQLNIENLLDTTYYASAHSNSNITPGAPRTLQLTWSTKF